ncbi:VWA domain-containing protein [Anatilimnocola sp. NA78]|uniref:vWA domain-containing protein n=1 Tax=Anatilimnocola sp. NA78 TaxID=3415683 RepID=UPI003CE51211
MSLAAPWALAWALLTIPIVVFYILKIRLKQVPVSTTIFWRQIYDEKAPRSLWQNLRHWLSLLVQIIWLLLLVAALAEPFFLSEKLQARRIVMVIDNSASMNATDVSPTRLAAAKEAAARYVASLRFHDEMAIISAGTHPRVVSGLTNHERTLQAAIHDIPKTDGPTRATDAVELAKRLLGDSKTGQVLIFSDGGFAEHEPLASDPLVRLQPIGTKSANIGITQFQVRRSLLDPVGYEILVEVLNAADEPAETRLDLDLNDNPIDVLPLKLAAGETWSRTFEKTSPTGGLLVAKLSTDDALLTDNRAMAILPTRNTQKVLLVSPGNLFLQKAFEANPLVELKTVKELPASYEPGVWHVFHRLVPKELPAGASFLVDPLEGSDLWEIGEPLANPIVTKQDSESPLMRHVRLDNVVLPQARQLKPCEGAVTLVAAVSGDPLYFSHVDEKRRALVLTVNLDEGDLTFRTTFPILVTNALSWFAGPEGEMREAIVSGAVTTVTLPLGKVTILRTPSGETRPLPKKATEVSIGPLDEVGIWKIEPAVTEASTTAVAPLEELACNLSSRIESDLRVPASWQAKSTAGIAAAGFFVRPLWFYLVAAAWLLAIGEWFLYQRRWIG